MLKFIIPNKDYSIKIIDSLAVLQSNLDSLSKELDDSKKIPLPEKQMRRCLLRS